jgi:P-type Ca2+ transporter type 2C
VFQVGFFSNRLIFAGIVFELVFAAILIYVPFFQNIFGTAPIDAQGWLVLAAFTPLVFVTEEVRKAITRGWQASKQKSKAGARSALPTSR